MSGRSTSTRQFGNPRQDYASAAHLPTITGSGVPSFALTIAITQRPSRLEQR
jgi:hypothetical protein